MDVMVKRKGARRIQNESNRGGKARFELKVAPVGTGNGRFSRREAPRCGIYERADAQALNSPAAHRQNNLPGPGSKPLGLLRRGSVARAY